MKNAVFLVLFSSFFIFSLGCNKVDPNPELRDAIYLDLQTLQANTARDLAEAEKTVTENIDTLNKVVPQTGQIKYAKKRVYEAQAAVERLKQQNQYYKVRIDERLIYTRKKYLESIRKNTAWPDQKEIEQYMTEKKLRQAKLQWDVKDRIEEQKKASKKESAPTPSGGE